MLSRIIIGGSRAKGQFLRFSTSTPPSAAGSAVTAPTAPVQQTAVAAVKPIVKPNGSTLGQRLNSFLVGAGIGFGICFYFVYSEIQESNEMLEKYITKLDDKITAIESKK